MVLYQLFERSRVVVPQNGGSDFVLGILEGHRLAGIAFQVFVKGRWFRNGHAIIEVEQVARPVEGRVRRYKPEKQAEWLVAPLAQPFKRALGDDVVDVASILLARLHNSMVALDQDRLVVVRAGRFNSEEGFPILLAQVMDVRLPEKAHVITSISQHVSNGGNPFRNRAALVVDGSAAMRVEAGQDGRAGRQAQSVSHERIAERDAFADDAVLVRS